MCMIREPIPGHRLYLPSRRIGYMLLSIIVFSIIVGSIIYYIFYPDMIDSDSVEGVLWAKATLESGRILSKSFICSYAIPFGANLFMLPFVKMLGLSTLANSLGMLSFFVILLACIVCFSYVICQDLYKSMNISCIILLAFRTKLGLNLLRHLLFYQLGFVCILGISSMVLAILQNDNKHRNSKMAFFIFFSIWGSANGIVTMTLSVIPVLAGLVIFILLDADVREKTVCLKLMCAEIVASCVGLALYYIAMSGAGDSGYIANSGSLSLQSPSDWFWNICSLTEGWVDLFITNGFNNIFDIIISCIEVIFSLAIGIVPIVVLYYYSKISKTEKYVLYITIAVWCVCLAQYIFFRGNTNRMLFNGLLMNYVLLSVTIAKASILKINQSSLVKNGLLVIMAILMAGFSCSHTGVPNRSITDELERRGLTYGVATYWNANINTVLSNERVCIREVAFWKGDVIASNYQVDPAWYQEPQVNKFFMLLTRRELDNINDPSNKLSILAPYETFEIDSYVVYVYPVEKWDELIKH